MKEEQRSEASSEGTPTSLMDEFTKIVEGVEAALSAAAQGAAEMRALLPRVAALEGVLGELDAAIGRVREQFPVASATSPAPTPTWSGGPPLRAVPATEPEEPVAEPEPTGSDARCFLLEVQAGEGSLDLKAVDRSVSENPSVVDVALLDYDGRRAALKIWVNREAQPEQVQSALTERLRESIAADNQAGDVSVQLSEESAA